jgi:uncharacterized membrane protein
MFGWNAAQAREFRRLLLAVALVTVVLLVGARVLLHLSLPIAVALMVAGLLVLAGRAALQLLRHHRRTITSPPAPLTRTR